MKFTTAAATLSLAALTSAADLRVRDLNTTLRVMNNVLDQMVVVQDTISKFSTADDLPAVSAVGAKMISIIMASDDDILVMENVPLADAQAFQPLSDKLNAQGDGLLAGVEAKIPVFGRAGVCDTLHTAVSAIGAGVIKLMNDVSDKFPQEGRSNNENTIQHFTDAFGSAIAKLKACADAGVKVDNSVGSGPQGDSYVTSKVQLIVAPTATYLPTTVSSAVSSAVVPARVTGAPSSGNGTVKAPVVHAGASLAGVAQGAVGVLLAAFLL